MMNSKKYLRIAAVILLGFCALGFAKRVPENERKIPVPNKQVGQVGPVACTAEAKLCPDGSGVGRVPPDCHFAPCPDGS